MEKSLQIARFGVHGQKEDILVGFPLRLLLRSIIPQSYFVVIAHPPAKANAIPVTDKTSSPHSQYLLFYKKTVLAFFIAMPYAVQDAR